MKNSIFEIKYAFSKIKDGFAVGKILFNARKI